MSSRFEVGQRVRYMRISDGAVLWGTIERIVPLHSWFKFTMLLVLLDEGPEVKRRRMYLSAVSVTTFEEVTREEYGR